MNGDGAGRESVFTNGRLRIDYGAGCAYLGEKEMHLTPIEYKLLCLMAQNVGKVLTHTYITQKVWGSSWDNDIASLRVFMATLRKKLESEPDSPQYIQTHIGVGYRMMKVNKAAHRTSGYAGGGAKCRDEKEFFLDILLKCTNIVSVYIL